MMHYDTERKLVYWGAGAVCKTCLKCYDEKPLFLIDSNPKEAVSGLEVKKADDVLDWNSLFVVITVRITAATAIAKTMESYGLKRDLDFAFYTDFFGLQKDIHSSLKEIKEYFLRYPEQKNGTVIFYSYPFFRQKEVKLNFFHQYFKAHDEESYIALQDCAAPQEYASQDEICTPTFYINDIIWWDGSDSMYEIFKDSIGAFNDSLNAHEKSFLCWLEDIEPCFNREKSFQVTKTLYTYIKKIISLATPKYILMNASRSRIARIFSYLAEQNEAECRIMEYGMLPGTFQFDPLGLAGESELAVKPSILQEKKVENKDLDIQAVKNYIIKTGIDSGNYYFKVVDADRRQLEKLVENRKTVFFIGMGEDYSLNTETDFWRKHYLPAISSNEDALERLRLICMKNNWNLMFKPHPGSRLRQTDDRFRAMNDVAYITDMAIDNLIKRSDVVVSLISAVDYKVLVYGKPLVSLGKMPFWGQEICYEVHDTVSIQRVVEEAMEYGMTESQKSHYDKFLHILLENYLWDDLSHPDFPYGLPVERSFFKKG